MSAVEEVEQEAASPAFHLPTDTLAASVIVLLVMTVVQRLVGFGRGVLFCRWLDPEQLGQWDVTFGFLMLASPLAVLGLPGSFGRYAEYYRQRGQLGTFLRRVSWLCGAMAVIAVVTIIAARDWFSELIFNRTDQSALVVWIAVCLATVIAHNFLVSLFIALRLYRVVNALQFFQSLGFALLSLPLLFFWKCDTISVILAFTVASVVPALAALAWLRRLRPAESNRGQTVGQREFWAKLVPFAGWIWVTNLLANLFEVVDRYMIVHHSGLGVDEALRQVGCYHSSRLIPLLFVAVASLIGSMITPHLSYDWEAGRRDAVARRLNTMLKGLCFGTLAASAAVLILAPYLFNVAFEGKFAAGLAVLPCTLAYCTWFGMFAVAQNYLWCAEKARLSSLALLAGVLINIGLNLIWLPIYGLEGAVAATTVANLVAILLVYFISKLHGMQVDRGTWLITLAPAALCLGPVAAAVAVVAVALASLSTDWLFTTDEKRHASQALSEQFSKIRSRWLRLPGNRSERALNLEP